MEKISLNVTGMSCSHCEKAVISALEDIGATEVKASAMARTVHVTFDPAKLTEEAIKKEITEMGYSC